MHPGEAGSRSHAIMDVDSKASPGRGCRPKLDRRTAKWVMNDEVACASRCAEIESLGHGRRDPRGGCETKAVDHRHGLPRGGRRHRLAQRDERVEVSAPIGEGDQPRGEGWIPAGACLRFGAGASVKVTWPVCRRNSPVGRPWIEARNTSRCTRSVGRGSPSNPMTYSAHPSWEARNWPRAPRQPVSSSTSSDTDSSVRTRRVRAPPRSAPAICEASRRPAAGRSSAKQAAVKLADDLSELPGSSSSSLLAVSDASRNPGASPPAPGTVRGGGGAARRFR